MDPGDGILKAIDDAKAHAVEASDIMAKYFKVDPQKYSAILEGSNLPTSNATANTLARAKAPGRSSRSPHAHLRSGRKCA
jgi:hypothetical protein